MRIWLATTTAEPARGAARAAELEAQRDRLATLLGDPAFASRAPANVVERERARLAEVEERLRQIGAESGAG